MPVLTARDGTRLAYQVSGEGTPVVCLPGGPLQDSASLGDLGGLSGPLRLIRPDYRGTGRSETPISAASYRCDALVDDVEALREHLRHDQVDVLAHCAGANLAVQYAARHPGRIRKLVLITPSTRAVGITVTSDMRGEIVQLRKTEPWFPPASEAFEAIQAGQAKDSDWEAITPLTYCGPSAPREGERSPERRGCRSLRRGGRLRSPSHRRSLGHLRSFPAASRGARRGSPAARRCRVRHVVPQRQACYPARRRPRPVARRPHLVHHDGRSQHSWSDSGLAPSGKDIIASTLSASRHLVSP